MIKHDVGAPQRDFYEAKEVCEVMGAKHTLLASPKPPATIDCMGRDVLVSDFCEKVTKEKVGLLRGRLDPFSDKVVCEYGQTVNVTYRCTEKSQSLCENSKRGCLKLRGVFARTLGLSHSSLLPDGADHRLNCYFSMNETENDAQILSSPFEAAESL